MLFFVFTPGHAFVVLPWFLPPGRHAFYVFQHVSMFITRLPVFTKSVIVLSLLLYCPTMGVPFIRVLSVSLHVECHYHFLYCFSSLL